MILKRKSSLLLSFLLIGPAFFLFAFSTKALAVCDFSVNSLNICYNSRTFQGGNCYNGNWRIRGSVSNVGDASGEGAYEVENYDGNFIVDGVFSLAPGGVYNSDNTLTFLMCGSIIYRSYCWADNNFSNGSRTSLTSANIPPCNPPTSTPVPTNTPVPTPTNTPIPTNTPVPTVTPTPTCIVTTPSEPRPVSPPMEQQIFSDSVTFSWEPVVSWGEDCGGAGEIENRYRVYLTTDSTDTADGNLTNDGLTAICDVGEGVLECVKTGILP